MKSYLVILMGLAVSGLSFAGGDAQPSSSPVPYTPAVKKTETTKTVTVTEEKDECPPLNPKKPKPCPQKPKPKVVPKKPTPKPCPAVVKCKDCPEPKHCPEAKPCPEVEPKIIERTVEKTKYVDRTVTIDQAPKNTFNIFVGVGPHGIVTDSFATEERKDEYAFRKEKDKSVGGLIGIQYQYRFSPSFNANGLIISNQTGMLGGGFSW
jgi:hypothetical protein